MEKRLKIVHITAQPNIAIGGIRTHLKTLLYCLDNKQTENIILTNESDELDRKEFEDLGVAVFSRLSSSQSSPSNPLVIIQWMTKMLKQLQPDIATTYSLRGNALGRQAAFGAGVPVIIGRGDSTIPNLDKKYIRIQRHLAKITDCIICVSEAVSKYTQELLGITEAEIRVIYNGLILEKYQFNDNYYKEDYQKSLDFVFVGRLEPEKAPIRLIEAFAEVIAKGYDCQLRIIGDGSLKQECKNRVETLGLSQKIQFLGYQEYPWSLVPKESVFVLSSDYEGFGLVVIEAMASGNLCILPTIKSVTEIAKPNTEAIFYEVGNPEQLLTAMIRVLQMSLSQKIQIIKAARSRVEKDFDAYQMAGKYLNLYRELYQAKSTQQLPKI